MNTGNISVESISFPYPELMAHFPNISVMDQYDYYLVRPSTSVKLLISKTRQTKNGYGIYIGSDFYTLLSLFNTLYSCEPIFNFQKEHEPWLFIDGQDNNFIDNLNALIKFLKTRRKKPGSNNG